MLRSTCVATLLEGGHATNALTQLAAANFNCRVQSDDSLEYLLETLKTAMGDDQVMVSVANQQVNSRHKTEGTCESPGATSEWFCVTVPSCLVSCPWPISKFPVEFFQFFKLLHHCSSVRLLSVGTWTIRSSQSDASPP